MTAIEILKAARNLITDPAHWTQYVFAKNARGNGVDPTRTSAVQFCANGALMHVSQDDTEWRGANQALTDAAQELGWHHDVVTYVNDNLSHAAVLDMFDRAIAHLEGEDHQ